MFGLQQACFAGMVQREWQLVQKCLQQPITLPNLAKVVTRDLPDDAFRALERSANYKP
jgi:hypothetical protein